MKKFTPLRSGLGYRPYSRLGLIVKQVGLTQLSQRDRAAGWGGSGQKWKMELGDNIYGHYGGYIWHRRSQDFVCGGALFRKYVDDLFLVAAVLIYLQI